MVGIYTKEVKPDSVLPRVTTSRDGSCGPGARQRRGPRIVREPF